MMLTLRVSGLAVLGFARDGLLLVCVGFLPRAALAQCAWRGAAGAKNVIGGLSESAMGAALSCSSRTAK